MSICDNNDYKFVNNPAKLVTGLLKTDIRRKNEMRGEFVIRPV